VLSPGRSSAPNRDAWTDAFLQNPVRAGTGTLEVLREAAGALVGVRADVEATASVEASDLRLHGGVRTCQWVFA